MSKNSDNSAGNGARPEPDAGNTSGEHFGGSNLGKAEAAGSYLPVVWSPQVGSDGVANEAPIPDAGDAVSQPDEEAEKAAPEGAAAASTRSSRFLLLAASVAIAAGLGSFFGSLTASGVMRIVPTTAAVPARVSDASAVLQAMKAQLAELSTIKSSLDGATRSTNGEFAKITDRLDRVEHAEADPTTKLAQIADTVARLDKRSSAAPETTGSIAPSAPPASASPPPTGETKQTDKVLEDWIVQDVRRGRAVVENKYGSVYFVGPGSYLPRLGSVETVKRQDGQWVVVTEHGLITSGR